MLFIVPFHAEILGIQGNEQHAKINFSTQKKKNMPITLVKLNETKKRHQKDGQVRVLNEIE